MKELWRRLKHLGRGSRFDCELNDEIGFHIESRAAELEQEGFPREEALARARLEFGRATRAIEETREAWSLRWFEELASDLRYAARTFRRNPGFALTAILCLGLGIGANTTIFNIITSVMFKQPSCGDVASLILIKDGASVPMADYRFIRDGHVFDGVAGIDPGAEVNWREGDQTRRLFAARVTGNYFGLLGVPVRLGRGIASGETNTIVLTERVWRGRFANDPQILGRRLVLDDRVYTVVGVLPENDVSVVGFGFSPDLYAPITRNDEAVQLYARMPPGMTRAMAPSRLQSLLTELDGVRPLADIKRSKNVGVYGVREIDAEDAGDAAPAYALFGMLMILVGLVLLIACTNVASLLLARASSRSQALAVRLSLGASRGRLVRHLLAESLLLALSGAAAGLAINFLCTRLLRRVTFAGPPPVELVFEPDTQLLLYAVGVAIASAFFCGLLPALKSARQDANTMLKAEARQTERVWGLRSVLVAGQLAISVVLLAAAFLFLENVARASTTNPGFDVNHIVWAYMRLVPDRYPDQAKRAVLIRSALGELRATPGVQDAAIAARVPLTEECSTDTKLSTDVDARPQPLKFACNEVGEGYFRAMNIDLLAGREFSRQDLPGGQRVAIVNEAFARKVFGRTDPGHEIRPENGPSRLIVGMVKDSHYSSLNEKPKPALYDALFPETALGDLHFLVRTAGPPESYVHPVATLLGRLDLTAAVEAKPMRDALGLAMFGSRAVATLLGAMGVLGLALASIGLYGVLLYSVSRRTREIGLRVALGATPWQVLRLVCRYSATLAGFGMGAGLVLAFVAMRPMAFFLVPGVSPSDPAPLVGVAGVLGLVVLAATIAPAIRALRVDPITALRYE